MVAISFMSQKSSKPSLLFLFLASFVCFAFLRTWLGIPTTTLASCPNQVICQETASVTTAKTTLGHVAAVEERDAVYLVGN